MSNEEIIRAFHLMWDNFPEAVMITQKSREIVAVRDIPVLQIKAKSRTILGKKLLYAL